VLPLADWISDHLLNVEPFELLGTFGLSWHTLSLFIAAAIMLWLFPKIAQDDGLVPGKLRSAFEVVLLFIRDEVARPFLHERTDRYVPVLWTFFFFILLCNLLGLVPGMATATGQVWVTGTLAVMAFLWYEAAGVYEQGLVPYVKNIVPPGLPLPLIPVLFVIEIVGHLSKPFALMIRLWANMTGGHAVLYAILGLTFTFGLAVSPLAVAGGIAVYVLEIFVAFLQAYVFTFLVSVFLGASVHPEH